MQQVAAEPFCVGGEHAGGHKPGGFIAAPAEHRHRFAAARQLVGDRQAHQPATQDEDRLGGCCRHGPGGLLRQ